MIADADRAESRILLARKAYEAPSLVRYGTIFDLTAENNGEQPGDLTTFASGELA